MTTEELNAVYGELSKVPQSAANTAVADLAAQQAAHGGLAAAMGATGGNGIGQYTYDRMIMPTVDSLTTQLVAEGKQAALNQMMKDQLASAKANYENAKASYASRAAKASSGGGNPGTVTPDSADTVGGNDISTDKKDLNPTNTYTTDGKAILEKGTIEWNPKPTGPLWGNAVWDPTNGTWVPENSDRAKQINAFGR